MSSRIDNVLQDVMAAGHVPNVVAIAADRNGVIYEGDRAPGPLAATTRSLRTPLPDHVDDQDGAWCTVAALQ
ncbi:MAG: hypothetical protein ACRDTX_00690 [Pseudonocardiaceae bacterium]